MTTELFKTKESYNKQADWHSSKFNSYDCDEYLLKFIKLLKGKKILDLGCGNGRDLEFFCNKNFDAIGVDYSKELIKKAKNRIKNIRILEMDFLKKLKFKNDTFDGIWACGSLLNVPKKSLDRILLELKRVLKNKGILFISVKEGKGERMVKDDYGECSRFFSFFKKQELVNKLRNIGFNLIHSFNIPDEKLRVGFKKKKTKQNWIILYFVKNV
jgi:SAM-dependent methyltransferase